MYTRTYGGKFMTKIKQWFLVASSSMLLACGGGSSNGDDDTGGEGTGGGGNNGMSFGQPNSAEDQIRPGVKIRSANGSCTSNFIFSDINNNFYIGVAAHCFSPDTNSNPPVDPCEARNAAYGSAVEIQNANHDGQLIYSSWQEMKLNGETPGSAACDHNDFAIVKIDSRDYANVHPAAIAFGGPKSLLRGGADNGDGVHSYGQSSQHNGVRSQEEKSGTIASRTADGWRYTVSFDNNALPGDSGSAVLHESGKALGVLTELGTCIGLCPLINNGVASLEMALDYANDNLSTDVSLVTWQTFTP